MATWEIIHIAISWAAQSEDKKNKSHSATVNSMHRKEHMQDLRVI